MNVLVINTLIFKIIIKLIIFLKKLNCVKFRLILIQLLAVVMPLASALRDFKDSNLSYLSL